MSDLFKCGFCDYFLELLRAVCSRNSRGDGGTCYRELRGENSEPGNFSDSPSDLLSTTAGSNGNTDDTSIAITSTEDSKRFLKLPTVIDQCEESDRNGAFFGRLRKSRSVELLPKSKVTLRNGPSSSVVDENYAIFAKVMLSKIDEWEFDSQQFHVMTRGHGLAELGFHLLVRYDLISHFNLQPENCWKLFHLIEVNYHSNNPYHNAIHATDVAQAVHVFVQQPTLLKNLSKIEILVLFLAALTHDLDHPGVNQTYLAATHHALAIMYKDKKMGKDDLSPLRRIMRVKFLERLRIFKSEKTKDKPFTSKNSGVLALPWRKKKTQDDESILERHHWRMAFGCISDSGVFGHMKTQANTIKKMLKSLILATDITRQTFYLDKFRNLITRENLNMTNAEHRLVVMQIALKTADISNPGRPWAISQKWSEKVCEEFFIQGDKERKLNIPVSTLCDRTKDTIPTIQIGFFKNVVKPLYTEWDCFLTSELSAKMMNNLAKNTAEWKRQVAPVRAVSFAEPRPRSAPNHSRSTEQLLEEVAGIPPRMGPDSKRRSSYSPTRASKVKLALRRLSAPLHVLVEAPRAIVEVLQRGEHSAQKKRRRSVEEVSRSGSLLRIEQANTARANRSRSASRGSHRMLRAFRSNSRERSTDLVRPRSPRPSLHISRSKLRGSSSSLDRPGSPRPKARVSRSKTRRDLTPSSIFPPLRQIEADDSPPTSDESSAKENGTASRLTRFRFGVFVDVESDVQSDSTSGTTTAYPGLSTVTGSDSACMSTPSSDMRFFQALTLDTVPASVAVSCEAVVAHVASSAESDDLLPLSVAPELVRRRGSAPVVAMPAMPTRRPTVRMEPRKLSASCNVIADAMPIVRRGSLPVMTGF